MKKFGLLFIGLGLMISGIASAQSTEVVNMGLSVNWAACNLGATTSSECGNFYAWGECSPKETYEWSNYKYGKGDFDILLKYNTNTAFGTIDDIIKLEFSDDAARETLGYGWRMPTTAEWQELIDNCRWSWTQRGGNYGYLAVSKINGAVLFLPIHGYREGKGNFNKTKGGYYWSASLQAGYAAAAEYLELKAESNSNPCSMEATFRSYGLLIRPVKEKTR